ncbi:MAG: TetR/AcrR family transcriptional regulator [Methylococcaceae bacterium]
MTANSKTAILQQAIPLFAEHGYDGVSMRDLARRVKMSPASLYHHFPDKKTLYLEMVALSFLAKAKAFDEVWQSLCPAMQKLKLFIRSLVNMMIDDQDFHRLMQRELLEANEQRLQLLAEAVFKPQFVNVVKIFKEIAPSVDAHLCALSLLGLACKHIELQALSRFFPEWKPEYEQAEHLAQHIETLLLQGINVG